MPFYIYTIINCVRKSFRSLVKSTRFSFSVVFILAIGISQATVMYTALQRVIYNQLPFPNADKLVMISNSVYAPGQDMAAWWSQDPSLTSAATFRTSEIFFSVGNHHAEHAFGTEVSPGFFKTLGVKPSVGILFSTRPQTDDSYPTAVVSTSLAKREFGSAAFAIGRTLRLEGRLYTIIGVMPASISFPGDTDIWIAPAIYEQTSLEGTKQPAIPSDGIIARLKRGSSIEAANSNLTILNDRLNHILKAATPTLLLSQTPPRVVPLNRAFTEHARNELFMLVGASLLILLITIVEASGLLLTRVLQQQHNIWIQIALGATKFNIALEIICESLFITICANIIAIFIAIGELHFLRTIWPSDIPRQNEISLNTGILVAGIIAALFIALAIATVPWMQNLRHISARASSEKVYSSKTATPTRRLLLTVQIAATVALVNVSLIVLSSLRHLTKDNLGFAANHLVTVPIHFLSLDRNYRPDGQVKTHNPSNAAPDNLILKENLTAHNLQEQIVYRVDQMPGISNAAFVSNFPFRQAKGFLSLEYGNGQPSYVTAFRLYVSAAYFQTMGIALLKGRQFVETDDGSSPKVIIISRSLATRLWPREDPIGKELQIETFPKNESREVIGVVADVRQQRMQSAGQKQMYLPWSQPISGFALDHNMALVIRTHLDPKVAAPAIIKVVQNTNGAVVVLGFSTEKQIIGKSFEQIRFESPTMSSFGGIAVLLGVIGIYSSMAYAVASRSHEIAIRYAFGANTRAIQRMFLEEAVWLLSIGIPAGLALSTVCIKLIAAQMYGAHATSWWIPLVSSLVFAAAILIAALLPTFRVSAVEPRALLQDHF